MDGFFCVCVYKLFFGCYCLALRPCDHKTVQDIGTVFTPQLNEMCSTRKLPRYSRDSGFTTGVENEKLEEGRIESTQVMINEAGSLFG